jgi:segregation and condensation protein A
MEEKNVPWWRRALSFALDGIRSGFGLFSRPQNHKAAEPLVIVAPAVVAAVVTPPALVDEDQQASPEEAVRWSEPSAEILPVAEPVHDSEPVTESVPATQVDVAAEELRDEPVAIAANVAQFEVAEPEPVLIAAGDGLGSIRRNGSAPDAAEVAEAFPALEARFGSFSETASAGSFTVLSSQMNSCAANDVVAVAEPEIGEEVDEAHELEFGTALLAPAWPEPETDTVADAMVEKEMPAEVALQEPAQDEPAEIEVGEIFAVEEIPVEQEAQAEVLEVEPPAIETPAPLESVPGLVPDRVEASGQVPEQESEFEVSIGEAEATFGDAPETVVEAPEKPRAAPEVESVAEASVPAIAEGPALVHDPVPELNVSPVELNEPATEEAAEETGGQAAADEVGASVESLHEELNEAEPAVEADVETEIVPELSPEPEDAIAELNEPMEVNEPNPEPIAERVPEQTAEPMAASEAAPGVEAVAEAPIIGASPDANTETAEVAQEPAAQAPQKHFIKLESRDNEADLSPFSVVVSEVYDGPLDLLLDLIRKQDIDIYDIPIARITSQFLAYVNQLKASDVDVAGEFIYTASLLIHIKSKMLLPRAPTGPEDAAEDPRRELVERLLEHERFKNAAQMLQQKQMLEAASWTNPGMREFKDDEGAEPEIAADTVDLVRVFRDILERARNRPVINTQEDSVTVGQMIQFLSRRLTMEDKPIALRRLLSHTKSERSLIAMFLALLELVRLQAILLRQDRAFSEIFIKKHTGFEGVMNEGLANARDDWR